MKLIGKAKEMFEKWYEDIYLINCDKELIKGTDCNYFNLLTSEMQFGVYQLFADSIDYYSLEIYTTSNFDNTIWFYFCFNEEFDTRQEAQQEAIKKLNNYIND